MKIILDLTEEEIDYLKFMLEAYGDGGFVSSDESELRDKVLNQLINSSKNMKLYLAVNPDGTELCCNSELYRSFERWSTMTEKEISAFCYEADGDPDDCIVILPKGSIEKLTGEKLTWENDPVEI